MIRSSGPPPGPPRIESFQGTGPSWIASTPVSAFPQPAAVRYGTVDVLIHAHTQPGRKPVPQDSLLLLN